MAAWLLRTGKAKKNGSPRENQQRPMIPIWLKKIEMIVVKTTKEISIATAEIHRLQSNGKLTRKGKKNQKYLKEERKVKISCSSLYAFIEKQKLSLKRLARKRKRKLKQTISKKWNNIYTSKPTRIHDTRRRCISQDPENLRPTIGDWIQYNNESDVQPCFDSLHQAEVFWRPIWEMEGKGNPNAAWLKEIESAMDACCAREGRKDDATIGISKDQITKTINKKKKIGLHQVRTVYVTTG